MFIIAILGKALAAMPQPLLESSCRLLASLLFALPVSRWRSTLANIHHAYPDKDEAWRRDFARKSLSRMIENILFMLAMPYMSEQRLKRQFTLSAIPPEIQKAMEDKQPMVALLPHVALMESSALFPLLANTATPKIGVIYRSFENKALERWAKQTRERFGAELLARKEGFFRAKDILNAKGIVVILFDQNAGERGVMSLFMGRIASSTDLPGKLATYADAYTLIFAPKRTGFWQAEMTMHTLAKPEKPEDLIASSNQWLEQELHADEDFSCSWLWMHQRWKYQDLAGQRLQLKARRTMSMDLSKIERRHRIWIRMPNWLGDVIMAIPLIRALRASRPDAEITLIAQKHFLPLLERLNLAEHLRALPARDRGYWRTIRSWRKAYPDLAILLTNSFRGDLEARLLAAPQRMGMLRPGKSRPLLTHTYPLPEDLDESQEHQTHVWERFFQHFGLNAPLDKTPLQTRAHTTNPRTIGLICGTENTPEKRWPVSHWRSLIEKLLQHDAISSITLFGTAKDRAITDAVAEGFEDARIHNRAGQTSLPEFMDQLCETDLLICNDTGGMHLANALGVPVLAIFGPTNPLRTGPIFDTPHTVIQPEGCPPSGGLSIDKVPAERIYSHISFL